MAIDTEERTSTTTSEPVAPKAGASVKPVKNNNKKVVMIVLIVVGALVLLGIVGSIVSGFLVKKGAESLFSAATGSTVELNTGSDGKGDIKIKTEDGEITSGTNQKLPADFPKSVPIYNKSAKLVNVTTFNAKEDGKTFTLTYELKDSADKVHAFYEKELSENGWEVVISTTRSGSYSVVSHNAAQSQSATATIFDDNGTTALSLMAMPYKP